MRPAHLQQPVAVNWRDIEPAERQALAAGGGCRTVPVECIGTRTRTYPSGEELPRHLPGSYPSGHILPYYTSTPVGQLGLHQTGGVSEEQPRSTDYPCRPRIREAARAPGSQSGPARGNPTQSVGGLMNKKLPAGLTGCNQERTTSHGRCLRHHGVPSTTNFPIRGQRRA